MMMMAANTLTTARRSSRPSVRTPSAQRCRVIKNNASSKSLVAGSASRDDSEDEVDFGRRAVLSGVPLAIAGLAMNTQQASAIQGLVAGRLPGLSEVDSDGFCKYTRPEGKSGGHGVGWSEIPPYSFKVPDGWDEKPTSIADLGGAEVDLRFQGTEGDLAVIVAPVLRFRDVGFNADVNLDQIFDGGPKQLITGFAPEITGEPLEDENLLRMEKVTANNLPKYQYEILGGDKLPGHHLLISATATRNRVYIITVNASANQWRKNKDKLLKIAESFAVSKA
mmetsp:Transcript_9672/g.21886  ORF Transcript_9672/g.21886 Transcript_9672/m.21886 type:complete len:280 (+) Transcript_9672:16-855(+)